MLVLSSRDACEASANRRLSGQHLDNVMARQKQLEHAADVERKRLEKVGTGNSRDPSRANVRFFSAHEAFFFLYRIQDPNLWGVLK